MKKNIQSLLRREFIANTSITSLGLALGCFTNITSSQASTQVKLPESITEAGKLLRNGAISSTQLTKIYLECIKQIEPKLNAFITITEKEALAKAAKMDAELKHGKDRGPLHGIPIVIKDLYDTAGIKTTVGSAYFKNRIPTENATVVQKLSDAGTVLLGKTNMNEFAAGISGTNQFFGDTHNPYDLDRSPGGSSSGTGAAIASRICLAGVGSDTGGSIRVPSSWDNLAGIRPTFGRISLYGAFPRAYSLDCGGPMARTVGDLALMMNAIAGYDPKYEYSLKVPAENFTARLNKGVKNLRIGIIDNYTFRDVDPDVAESVQSAIKVFEKLGAQVETVQIPLFSGPLDYTSLFDMLLYEFNQILGKDYWAEPNRAQLFGPIVQANIEKGMKISKETYEKAKAARPKQILEVKEAFKSVDVLLTPTMPTVAPTLVGATADYDRGRQFTLPFSWVGLPSISIPAGFGSNGLPLGIQVVGNDLDEALLLQVGNAFEGATKYYMKEPKISSSSYV